MRQSTMSSFSSNVLGISKLPMRQSTLSSRVQCQASVSKLPMRQSTTLLSSRVQCQAFLSCLCGSQLQKKVKELRRHRGKTYLHLFYPKFQQGARKADRIGFSCIGQKFWSKFRDRCTIAQAIGAQCSGLLYLTGCLLDEEGKGLRGR